MDDDQIEKVLASIQTSITELKRAVAPRRSGPVDAGEFDEVIERLLDTMTGVLENVRKVGLIAMAADTLALKNTLVLLPLADEEGRAQLVDAAARADVHRAAAKQREG